MKERHQRRPLPACAHVVAAKIVDHVDPEPAGKRRTVANLFGQPGLGLVAHRVAGEAGDGDLLPAHAGLGQQRLGGICVERGQRTRGLLAPAPPLDHRPEPGAQIVRIGGSCATGRSPRR